MGKVNVIQKSRKECKCSKCQKVIPVGSKYYRGTINFNPDIIRCQSCGLQSWEVTTSDYQLQVGEIVYRWQENYGAANIDTVQSIVSDLESIRDELQDKLDNMPEQLQDSDTGMTLQDRIESLESAIDDLEGIDEDDVKSEALEGFDADESAEDVDWMEDDELAEALEEKFTELIDEALGQLDV